jgi:hypothetical protein
MAIPARKRSPTKTTIKNAGRQIESRASEALDANLRLIFDRLAQLLVANGYSFARVGKLVKISFVNAAKSIDREKGEKVSKARIAALTGLTRTEVSQILRSTSQDFAKLKGSTNRSLRVVHGWLTDSRFLHSDNSPRALHFKGVNPSFSHLVKKYSGDIPARAMLIEMKRLRIVRHDAGDNVHLVRTRLQVSRRSILAIRAISPWIEMLTKGVSANHLGEVTAKTKQLDLTFNSLPQLLAAVRELEHRRIAFVNGLEQLGSGKSANLRHSLKISVAVAAERAAPTRKQHR